MMLSNIKILHKRSLRARGFTLVELAVVLVITALLLGMAAKGMGLLDQGKGDQLVLQVRQLETQANEYRRTHQRWPGDCDGNGRIDSSMTDFESAIALRETQKLERAALFDYTATPPFASTDPPNGDLEIASAPGKVCPAALSSVYIGSGAYANNDYISDLNLPLNELKVAGLLSLALPNRIAATHAAGDFMALTKVLVINSGKDEAYNAIVLFNVPVSMARKLAVAMDGFDGDAAYKGRVRRLGFLGDKFETSWLNNTPVSNETQDSLITIAYFFDQLPLPITYQ